MQNTRMIKDRYYPICSRLGLLRRTLQSRTLVISTKALYQALGNARYQQACLEFEYKASAGPTPASVERFLASEDARARQTKLKNRRR